jgi:hypothetical protein
MTDRMKPIASLLLLVAACGPAAKTAPTTTETPTTTTTGGAVELWAAVMKPGATFGFRDSVGGEDASTVDATVKEVTDVAGGKAATIEWLTDGDAGHGLSGLPGAIIVTATSVHFQDELTGEPGELTWPAAARPPFEEEKDGYQLYLHDGQLKGEVCYGEGPGKDAGECEDVCFAELCVHPTHGLTGGGGTWWPDYSEYIRRDLSK